MKAELHSLSAGRLLHAARVLVSVLLQTRLGPVLLEVRELLGVDGAATLTATRKRLLGEITFY